MQPQKLACEKAPGFLLAVLRLRGEEIPTPTVPHRITWREGRRRQVLCEPDHQGGLIITFSPGIGCRLIK